MNIDVFISYHTESSLHIVNAIANRLEGVGIRCWYSNRDNHRNSYAASITEAVSNCRVFLLVLNRSASYSTGVLNELEFINGRLAQGEPVYVVPFHVADKDINPEARFYIQRYHWIDAMTPPVQERIDYLAEYVQRIIKQMDESAEDFAQTTEKAEQEFYERNRRDAHSHDVEDRPRRKSPPRRRPAHEMMWEEEEDTPPVTPGSRRRVSPRVVEDVWEEPITSVFEEDRWWDIPNHPVVEEDDTDCEAFDWPHTKNREASKNNPFEEWGFDLEEFFKDDWMATPSPSEKYNLLRKDCFSFENLGRLRDRSGQPIRPSRVTSIRFEYTLKHAPYRAVDISHEVDESVLMWLGDQSGYQRELVVGADGIIDARLACEDLFNGMHALEQIDFGGCFSTEGATSMLRMFQHCGALERLDTSVLDTAAVTNMAFMFHGCSALTELDVSGFDTSRVEIMNSMFDGCYHLEHLDIRNFDFSSIRQVNSLMGHRSFAKVQYDLDAVKALNGINQRWFCESLGIEKLPEYRLLEVDCFRNENLEQLEIFKDIERCERSVGAIRFTDSIADASADAVDVSHEKDGTVLLWAVPWEEKPEMMEVIVGADGIVDGRLACADMFVGLWKLEKITFGSAFSSRGATSMARMFDSCDELREVDLDALDTSTVNVMSYMFYGCGKLEKLDLSGFNTSRLQWMNHMFDGCNPVDKLDLTGFDFSNVEQLDGLFGEGAKCTVAFDPDALKVLSKRNWERFHESLGMPEEHWKYN